MIKLYFISLHILLVALIYLLFVKSDCPEFTARYHNELLAFHSRIDKNLSEQYVVFFGDSHIQGLAVQEIIQPAINYGMGSDTTDGLLNRLPFFKSIKTAKAVVILIGFNDLRTKTNEELLSNLEKIIQSMPADRPVIMLSLLPVDEARVNNPLVTNKRINLINEQIKIMLNIYSQAFMFDINSDLKGREGELAAAYHIGDGIHLSLLGYATVIDQLKNRLKFILDKENLNSYDEQ